MECEVDWFFQCAAAGDGDANGWFMYRYMAMPYIVWMCTLLFAVKMPFCRWWYIMEWKVEASVDCFYEYIS